MIAEIWKFTTEHATVLATVATAFAACITAWFTFILTKSIKLARQEFISTHRPRLRIRGIQTNGLKFGTFIKVVNVGETDASITGVIGVLVQKQASTWLPAAPKLEPVPLQSDTERLVKAGEERAFGLFPDQIPDGQAPIFLVGVIKYADGIGTQRTTGFSWFYDAVQNAFIHPTRNDQYDYEYNYED